MISQTAEYALRLIVYLASLEGKPATIAQIASATRTPAGYLPKVLRNLARAGLVRSQRGPHGGSVLTKSPQLITVWDVIEVVDPIQRILTCPLGMKTHDVSLCPLHRRLDQAIGLVESSFRATTIAQVVAEPSASVPLTDSIPTEPASGLVSARVLRRTEP